MFNPNFATKVLTTLFILPISLGGAAEASTVHHLHEGLTSYRNDGVSEIITTDGNRMVCMTEAYSAAWPLPGGKGEEGAALMESSTRSTVSSVLYDENTSKIRDTITHSDDRTSQYGYTLGQAHSSYVNGCF